VIKPSTLSYLDAMNALVVSYYIKHYS